MCCDCLCLPNIYKKKSTLQSLANHNFEHCHQVWFLTQLRSNWAFLLKTSRKLSNKAFSQVREWSASIQFEDVVRYSKVYVAWTTNRNSLHRESNQLKLSTGNPVPDNENIGGRFRANWTTMLVKVTDLESLTYAVDNTACPRSDVDIRRRFPLRASRLHAMSLINQVRGSY